jgi:hypothetical protein
MASSRRGFGRRVAGVAAVVVALVACGCRSKPGETTMLSKMWPSRQPSCGPEGAAVTTRVASGDTIRGHLYPDQGCQCFYFEGVESTLLDLEISTDVGNEAAPALSISTPDGRDLALRPALGPEGSSCQRAKDVVLPRTGTYRVSVCKTACQPEHYWKFTHSIRVVPPVERCLHLTPQAPQAVSFTAPDGSRVLVRVAPESKCGVVPTVVSVKDPDGGRALDRSAAPSGAPGPLIGRADDGSMLLDFPATKAGRYTVLLASQPGTQGPATTSVSIRPPKEENRKHYHGGWPCPEGVPTKANAMAAAPAPVLVPPTTGPALARR